MSQSHLFVCTIANVVRTLQGTISFRFRIAYYIVTIVHNVFDIFYHCGE